MLNDTNVIFQRDPAGALSAILNLPEQAAFTPEITGEPSQTEIKQVIFAGMGGSALAADMIKNLVINQVNIPIEVIKGYSLPAYVNPHTLVITISHSGNTEETLSCYDEALAKGGQLAVMATGGKLIDKAVQDNVIRSIIPNGSQPRMSTVYHLRILLKLLQRFSIIDGGLYNELGSSADWLKQQLEEWSVENPTADNLAKQIAERSAGKIGMFYGGELTSPIAYKWKISWNESAKNLAFYNQYPEFNHNEFIGWSSHPVEKPFIVFDIISNKERPRITERMVISDQMLSGKRPHSNQLQLKGDTLLRQFLWGLALADMSSVYLAILNNVNPTPVELVENFKKALS